jgi:LmbE family N-acetylglucosaminyl deacetylase
VAVVVSQTSQTADPPSFDSAVPGTTAEAWQGWLRREPRIPLSLADVRRVVVVGAHPDDESLGAGGLVLAARGLGVHVDLVCVTDGRMSHPRSRSHTPTDLGRRRFAEWVEASQRLGVEDGRRHWLGLPDGEAADHEEAVTTALVDVIGRGHGTVLVSPWRRDGHPDHEAVGRAAAAAARRTDADLWEYPVWAWHWAVPGNEEFLALRPLPLSDELLQDKRAAVAAHVSQTGPLSDAPGDESLLLPAVLAHFEGPSEWFAVTPGAECPDETLERLHQDLPDPWGVDSRWYERRKRELLLAVLPRPRFGAALEIGCSTGALTRALATRADAVTGVDSSASALRAARQRLSGITNVELRQLHVPRAWPDGEYDLVVLSEVGYFLSPDELTRVVDRVSGCLAPDAAVVLCHWRHHVRGWVLDADAVHGQVERQLALPLRATYADDDVEIRVHASSWPRADA